MPALFPALALVAFARTLLERSGLDADKAQTVAAILVEGDLLGHHTHGLQLLPAYLADLANGAMAKTGEPRVVADFPAAVTWDGQRLPGPWLTERAIDLAIDRARINGTCTVVVRRSHHIACLAAYLKRVADRGLMVMLACTDPTVASVAPHGGRRGLYTPNPLAAAWPTAGDPVLLDISMSIATNALSARLHREGRKFPGPWAVNATGQLSDDPAVLFTDPPGALLPIGGDDHGHKGYALGLLVETLTGALAGHGRADPKEGWTATTWVQVLDPALFGGREEFVRQTEWLADACRATPPRDGFAQVRLPGETALRRRETQLAHGVDLYPGILPALLPWAEKLAVPAPLEKSVPA
jgi:LDH2 family malate/lactate/ureidoglycolate dehydrogenase